jgi:hypothetical protein
MLREIARVLSDESDKRVMIVDTSNEIAGDGDIPHPAIGHSRRMQVVSPERQAEVMIEAVENHMPEVIIIDEIGTEAEAQAARSIAERGVQLIGTAHGNTLDNLILNPTLSDLIGGIHSVTLSDEEARRRGSQKTVLERKAPPTFDVVIELKSKDELAIHSDVAAIVDGYLRDDQPQPEIRKRNEDGTINVVQKAHIPSLRTHSRTTAPDADVSLSNADKRWRNQRPESNGTDRAGSMRVFPYGISRNYLERAVYASRGAIEIVRNLDEANVILTLKGQLRKLPFGVRDAERHGLRVCAVRSNTQAQISSAIEELMGDSPSNQEHLTEAEEAAKKTLNSEEPVELAPVASGIRRLQHQLAERYGLKSTSVGLEPNRRVIIYRK